MNGCVSTSNLSTTKFFSYEVGSEQSNYNPFIFELILSFKTSLNVWSVIMLKRVIMLSHILHKMNK